MERSKLARTQAMKKRLALLTVGTTLVSPLSACDLGTFTSTSTVTLDGREVVSFLVRGAILSPIEALIDRGINAVFGEDEPNV